MCIYKIYYFVWQFLQPLTPFSRLIKTFKTIKNYYYYFFFISIYSTFSTQWNVTVSTFFLVISSPCSNSNTRARRQSYLRKIFCLRRCTLLSRIMKLESRPICGPCGAIFFNYSCRSSTSSRGRRQQVRRVVANKKALFEEERRLENVIASRGRGP